MSVFDTMSDLDAFFEENPEMKDAWEQVSQHVYDKDNWEWRAENVYDNIKTLLVIAWTLKDESRANMPQFAEELEALCDKMRLHMRETYPKVKDPLEDG